MQKQDISLAIVVTSCALALNMINYSYNKLKDNKEPLETAVLSHEKEIKQVVELLNTHLIIVNSLIKNQTNNV